jgi:hypothetical protein
MTPAWVNSIPKNRARFLRLPAISRNPPRAARWEEGVPQWVAGLGYFLDHLHRGCAGADDPDTHRPPASASAADIASSVRSIPLSISVLTGSYAREVAPLLRSGEKWLPVA